MMTNIHWTKAESIIKKLLENPSEIRALPLKAAEQLINDRINSLIKLYHPDKQYFNDHNKFNEIMEVQELIDKYSFKTIYDSLKLAPGARSNVRTQILAAQVKNLQERVKINITNLVEEFGSGEYFYTLANNSADRFLLLTNPSAFYPAKSIDLDSILEDKQMFPYIKTVIERSAKDKIPILKAKSAEYTLEKKQQEILKLVKKESLKYFEPLGKAISKKSLNLIKTEVENITKENENSFETTEGIMLPKLKDVQKAINAYIRNQYIVAQKIQKKNLAVKDYEKLQNIIHNNSDIQSFNNAIKNEDTPNFQHIRNYISKTSEQKNILKLKKSNQPKAVYKKTADMINTQLDNSRKALGKLFNEIIPEESFIGTVKSKIERKKDFYLRTIKSIDDRIKLLENSRIKTDKKIEEYENLNITESSVRNYLDIQPDILGAVGEEIVVNGSAQERKLIIAREYMQKLTSGEFKPRYSALIAIHIDEHLRINYKTLPSLGDKLPDNTSQFIKTNKNILGIMNTAIINKPGIPHHSRMLTTPEGFKTDESMLSPEMLKNLVFFENLFNNIEQNHINSNYGLISVEFREHQPIYRIEGMLASNFFKNIADAKTKYKQ